MATTRLAPLERKLQIFNAAVELCCEPGGWISLTRARIAKEARVSEGLVSVYLKDMEGLKRRILLYAIKHEFLEIVAQGIACGTKIRITAELREKVRLLR